MKSIKYHH